MEAALAFPFLNVYLHPGPEPVLETQWLGFATGAEFRASVAQALELGREHHVRGWIADDRRLGAVRPRDLQWTHDEVLLAFDRMGLRRLALLESEDALNRLTIDSMYQRALETVSFELRRFTDIEAARAWAAGRA
ncbi:hypothetical protein Q5H92_09925 [Hymenobacter sp. M29]|uniref:STAS/SEC14 domain-containing protein n=1 Tax=Hymenobacter mellowenesis TaxID=3063995 RepID=A0ABT9AA12_9BACT|nr:hypothetical protein [Hymenobacter sp. M29]MDO7846674.1 hypothetical protein [Hymenobacter sp. M29]